MECVRETDTHERRRTERERQQWFLIQFDFGQINIKIDYTEEMINYEYLKEFIRTQ